MPTNPNEEFLTRLQGLVTRSGGVVPAMQFSSNFSSRANQLLDSLSAVQPIIQQAQPVSPTNGLRWLEVDGSGRPVQEWYWDSSVNGGCWLSTPFVLSTGRRTSSSSGVAGNFGGSVRLYSGIYFKCCAFSMSSGATWDGTNYWTTQLWVRDIGSTGPIRTWDTTVAINETVVQALNVARVGTVGNFSLDMVKYGSAANHDAVVSFILQHIR